MAARVKSANSAARSGSSGGMRPNSTSATGERKIVGQYMLGKTIGEGTFGKVKLAVHLPTGEKVAVKILEKSRIREQADVRRVNREIKILKKTRHPNIIQLFEVLDTENTIYLIMEHADGGEMFDYIVSLHRVPEREACVFFHQIINGTEALHQNCITHRDLKPENLLLKPAAEGGYVIKIVDFGLSNTHEGGRLLQTACGSPCYAAPEMIAGKEYVGPIADMWSMGVILFALVCGYLPFEDQNTSVLYRKILSGSYTAPQWISSEVKDLIRRILETDPKKRITVNEIRQHPWYLQVNDSNIPTDVSYSASSVDGAVHNETLTAMANAGVDIQVVLDGLASHSCNGATAMYHLLYKKVFRKVMKERERAASQQPNPSVGGSSKVNKANDPESKIRERDEVNGNGKFENLQAPPVTGIVPTKIPGSVLQPVHVGPGGASNHSRGQSQPGNNNPNLVVSVANNSANVGGGDNKSGVTASPFSQQFQQQQPTLPPNTTRHQVTAGPAKSPTPTTTSTTPYHQPPVLPQQHSTHTGHAGGGSTTSSQAGTAVPINAGGDVTPASVNHYADVNEKRAHSAGSTRSGGFRGVRMLKMPQHLGGNVMLPINSPYVQVPKLNLPAVHASHHQQPSPIVTPLPGNTVVINNSDVNTAGNANQGSTSPRAAYINDLSDRVAASMNLNAPATVQAPTPIVLQSQTARDPEATRNFHLEIAALQAKQPLTARAPTNPQPSSSQGSGRRPSGGATAIVAPNNVASVNGAAVTSAIAAAPVVLSAVRNGGNINNANYPSSSGNKPTSVPPGNPTTVRNNAPPVKTAKTTDTVTANPRVNNANNNQTHQVDMEEGFRFAVSAPTYAPAPEGGEEAKTFGDDVGVPVSVPAALAEMLGINMEDVGETRPSTRRSHMRSRGGADSREAEGTIPARPQSAMGDEGMDMHSRHNANLDPVARVIGDSSTNAGVEKKQLATVTSAGVAGSISSSKSSQVDGIRPSAAVVSQGNAVAGSTQWPQMRQPERPPVVRPVHAPAPDNAGSARPTFSAGGRRGKNLVTGLTGVGL